MKRQMKLIALILAHVESAKSTGDIPIPEFKDYSRCEVLHHARLCEEAGYLDISLQNGTPKYIVRMTWNGYNALDSLREKYLNAS